jgi:hypothetical protein
MSSALTLIMLLHIGVTFVFVGVFVSLCAFFGTTSTALKAAVESRATGLALTDGPTRTMPVPPSDGVW